MSRPQPEHPWREDRLGRVLRDGLVGRQPVRPSPAVWERVAAELERSAPPPARPDAWAVAPPARRPGWAARWASFRFAPLAAVLVLYVVAWANLIGPLPGPAPRGTTAADGPLWAGSNWRNGLDEPELKIQPVLAPRPINRALPPGRLTGREARATSFGPPEPEPRIRPTGPMPQLNVR
jgi:hypothetical protein